MMWLWAVRHPFVSKGVVNRIKADQEVLDTLYNMIIDKTYNQFWMLNSEAWCDICDGLHQTKNHKERK